MNKKNENSSTKSNSKNNDDNNIDFIQPNFIKEFNNTFDSFSNSSNLQNNEIYFKCLECLDCPRIIFEKKKNKIVIKAYCYSHKKVGIYTLNEFISKFRMIKTKEIEMKNEGKINISKLILKNNYSNSNLNFPSQSNSILQNDINILSIDSNNKRDERKKLRINAKYCIKHNNPYTKYLEIEDSFICDYCYSEMFKNQNNIQKYINDVRIENIWDLISKVNRKINYIEKSLKDAEAHIENIKNIKNIINDEEINKYIDEYIEENNNILLILSIMLDNYKYSKEQSSLTFPIIKNLSELIFYFNPIPNENEENYKIKLIYYLQDPNNFIINHHLKQLNSISFKIPDEKEQKENEGNKVNKITRIIKLPNNRLCIGVNYMIHILNYNLDELFNFENDSIYKLRIWDIKLLSDGRIATLASNKDNNLCNFFKINENKEELVGKITYDVINGENFNSFLILSDDYVAIHTWHYLYIFKIPKNINEKTNLILKEEYTDLSIDVFSCLLLREKKENIISFFSILSGYNMVIPWEFNLETEKINKPFELGCEKEIHYSMHIGSVAKFNDDYFIIGGLESHGFYLMKYSDGKLYVNCKPNIKNHFQGVCVMPDKTFVFGENYGSQLNYLKRYQMIDKDFFLVDNISLESDQNSIKSNPTTIIYLDNSTVIVGDYNGTLTLWG